MTTSGHIQMSAGRLPGGASRAVFFSYYYYGSAGAETV